MMPPSLCAGVAQLVEHFLAKEDVASSSLVTRFRPLVPRGLQRGTARCLDLVCKVHSTQRAKASRRSSALAENRRAVGVWRKFLTELSVGETHRLGAPFSL